jgi:hypothetical protein
VLVDGRILDETTTDNIGEDNRTLIDAYCG